MPITVVLADDHPLMLRGLQGLLSSEVDFKVVAECVNGEEALRSIRIYQPDLAVVDLSMPQRDGLSVSRELNREKKGRGRSEFSSADRRCFRGEHKRYLRPYENKAEPSRRLRP